jgi:beta-phosphoglucomutase
MPVQDTPFSTLAGAVFDLDGTVLDNMPFHIEAFNAFASRHGLPALTLERRKWMDGKRNRDIFPGLFERVPGSLRA